MKKRLDLYSNYVVYSSMEWIEILKVLGTVLVLILYLKGGVLTMEYYFKLTNLIAVS